MKGYLIREAQSQTISQKLTNRNQVYKSCMQVSTDLKPTYKHLDGVEFDTQAKHLLQPCQIELHTVKTTHKIKFHY